MANMIDLGALLPTGYMPPDVQGILGGGLDHSYCNNGGVSPEDSCNDNGSGPLASCHALGHGPLATCTLLGQSPKTH